MSHSVFAVIIDVSVSRVVTISAWYFRVSFEVLVRTVKFVRVFVPRR